ncbi:MAG: hypothetical protein WD648_15290, partial [Planctomycetaceae bacterium]
MEDTRSWSRTAKGWNIQCYANESGIQREQRPKQGDSAPFPPGRRQSLTAPAAQQADLTLF